MTTSYVAHRAADGARLRAILSLDVLRSVDHAGRQALKAMGVHTVSDLLNWVPVHRARLIAAIAAGDVAHDMDLRPLVSDSAIADDPAALTRASSEIIDGVGSAIAATLRQRFNVSTVSDLAVFAPFLEAEALLRSEAAAFSEDASAPDELIPRTLGAVASQIRFSTVIINDEVALGGVKMALPTNLLDDDPQAMELARLFAPVDGVRLPLGYVALHSQKWINVGTHLGEVLQTVGLAPGESRNVAVIDWRRSRSVGRTEDTQAQEALTGVLVHNRALDAVAQATAAEHQRGRTEAMSATAVAGLGAVGGAALMGAAAGGAVGTVTGVSVGAVAGAVGGGVLTAESGGWGAIPGAIGGAAAGAVGGSFAGAVGGAFIGGAAGAVGSIYSESHGDRNVVAMCS
jgi:hypothetical protein